MVKALSLAHVVSYSAHRSPFTVPTVPLDRWMDWMDWMDWMTAQVITYSPILFCSPIGGAVVIVIGLFRFQGYIVATETRHRDVAFAIVLAH